MIVDKLREECAVFGISIDTTEAAEITYGALTILQHRGQDSSGIATAVDEDIQHYKRFGLACDVFTDAVLAKQPKANVAIGHNKYSVAGQDSVHTIQPVVVEFYSGRIAVAYNGNITNLDLLKEKLNDSGAVYRKNSNVDILAHFLVYHIREMKDYTKGVIEAVKQLEGAFSLLVLCADGKIIAVRDPNGYRPLCLGENESGVVVSSESCAIDGCLFNFIRDVKPGEIITIKDGKIIEEKIILTKKTDGICIFEYIYFARPDSVIDGLSVYEARYNLGKILAEEHPIDADMVCGVPDTGLEAAMGYSAKSGIPLASGIIRNRYVGRSFIYPTQDQRDYAVRLKLNPITAIVKDKRIVLIDDSIVRGTTATNMVRLLKNAGVLEVHLRLSSPPFYHTCHYGTDIGDEKNLIANRMSMEEMRRKIGADSLGFISFDGLKRACEGCVLPFCTKCFTGNKI
ncbi:MAG: amidophosphoribosyltransferase [Oscillospiraceae bacterium]|nr:amidophosphoribosyltransferase [Oscillospiraceae bacterium]